MMRKRSTFARFILENSFLLLAGTLVAIGWENADLAGYDRIARLLPFWVNEAGMVFFFTFAAKEAFETTLPGDGGCIARTIRHHDGDRHRGDSCSALTNES